MREMSVNEAVLIFCLVVFGMFVGAPAFSELHRMGLNEWLYRWQTLLGGTLAVFAAWLTIRQMRTSDEKGDRRHEDILRVTLLADQRRVERCVNPYAMSLHRTKRTLEKLAQRLQEGGNKGIIQTVRLLNRVNSQFDIGAHIIKTPNFVEGRKLFKGALDNLCTVFERSIEFAKERVNDAQREWSAQDETTYMRARENDGRLEIVLEEIEELAQIVDELVTGLNELAREYGVAVTTEDAIAQIGKSQPS